MVLELLRRFANVKERRTPEEEVLEQLGLAKEEGEPPVVEHDLYTLLEDERIGHELWPYVLAFATRDMKLTNFDDYDEKYLFWKSHSLATQIGMAINAAPPSPRKFARVEDYVKYSYGVQLLVENLQIWMYAVAKRAHYGFERRMLGGRIVA